jgi:hypothetical protein
MPYLSALEASIWLNWCGISHWSTWGIVWATLLLNWGSWSLLMKALGLLS